jgi:hypothetical protein
MLDHARGAEREVANPGVRITVLARWAAATAGAPAALRPRRIVPGRAGGSHRAVVRVTSVVAQRSDGPISSATISRIDRSSPSLVVQVRVRGLPTAEATKATRQRTGCRARAACRATLTR